MSDLLNEIVCLLVEDGSPDTERLARELTENLLKQRAAWQAEKNAHSQLESLRNTIYAESGVADKIARLRQLSRQMRGSEMVALAQCININLDCLQKLVRKDAKLPESLRNLKKDTGGIRGFEIADFSGRSVGGEYCATCDLEITPLGQDRWRCLACVEDSVHCVDCQWFFQRHKQCGNLVVLEHEHPSFRCLDIQSASGSLASTIYNIFQAWSIRPCFRTKNGEWLTYKQVYEKVAKIASLFKKNGASEILLCYPAGSIDFYFADLACALSGITSVACPVSPPPTELPEQVEYIVCDEKLKTPLINLSATSGATYTFLNLDEAHCLTPFRVNMTAKDPMDAVYTVYYTSGSTGVPKRIPETRQAFVRDSVTLPDSCLSGCCLSFLPPYWATDRMCVYNSLYNGHRVGFARREPSFPEIVEDIQEIQPTFLTTPPTLPQFLMNLSPPVSLGNQLQWISCGGAPVSSAVTHFMSETYGVPCRESYGITECGTIMNDGKIFGKVIDVLRLRDLQTGDWLDWKQKESVVGELWVRDFNTKDVVQISNWGKHLRVLGRSEEALSFKMENGKWCSLVDIEDKIMRVCSPDLLKQAVVTINSKQDLVLVAVPVDKTVQPKRLLQEIRMRVTLKPDSFPRAIVVSEDPFPMTQNYKIKRGTVLSRLRDAIETAIPDENTAVIDETSLFDMASLASLILEHSVDAEKSFLENGGDSISSIRWLKEVKHHFPDSCADWRSLLNLPLAQLQSLRTCFDQANKADTQNVQELETQIVGKDVAHPLSELDLLPEDTVGPVPDIDSAARHILLTGATGFLGHHILCELLKSDKDAIIVCLVRPRSKTKLQESEHVLVVTRIPTDLHYRKVIHLAAQVDHIRSYKSLYDDNVQLTKDILHLRLAPMLYCSTVSTQRGQPPFKDGYTQTKFESEKLVLRSGGQCVWPPFLLWGNKKDWLTRLVHHCIDTGTYPSPLGFLPGARVEDCAKEIVEGRPCSTWDLDLTVLFTRIMMVIPLRPVKLSIFRANAAMDPSCALYPIIPLLQGSKIGQSRSSHLELMSVDSKDIEELLSQVGCTLVP